MNVTERHCGICGRVKPTEQFSKHYSYCKPCDAIYGGAWDESNHERDWPNRLSTEPYRTVVRWAADIGATGPQLRDLGRRLVQPALVK
jgi:endogenous inhibitor of DNA gyrase (YacG/DUF329 family)